MADDLFAGRELCPDGACIGLIGADGLCRECGRVGASAVSDPRLRFLDTDSALQSDDAAQAPAAGDAPRAAAGPSSEAVPGADLRDSPGEWAPGEFENRLLCPDGACIGVVGEDGKCKECGTLAAPLPHG